MQGTGEPVPRIQLKIDNRDLHRTIACLISFLTLNEVTTNTIQTSKCNLQAITLYTNKQTAMTFAKALGRKPS
jgi:hypothetical protein